MKTVVSLLTFIAVQVFCGCYDFSLSGDNHTVTDFTLLAVHAEPPFLKPGEPLTIEALYADPKGGGRTVSCAWKIDYYDQNRQIADHPTVILPSKSSGTRVELPPLHLRLADKGTSPLLALEVYLCGGEMRDPGSIADSSDSVLFQTLCPQGPIAVGEKSLGLLSNNLWGVIGASNADLEMSYNQNNPVVGRLLVNEIQMTAVEDGGGALLLCDNQVPCDEPLSLSAYLDPSSIDEAVITPTSPDAGMLMEIDTTTDADAGISKMSLAEQHRIDWWVTGGSLTLPWSNISSTKYQIPTLEETVGPYQTSWKLQDSHSDAEYTLYVVARDLRGGNGWKTYRFYTKGK
jgi:hypothetical protein